MYSVADFTKNMLQKAIPVKGHVLVTGGAGFLGTTLVPMLLDEGYEVTIYDILHWGILPVINILQHPLCHFIKGDVCDQDKLATALTGKSAIIHLAAIVGYPACDKDPDLAINTNVGGTKMITSLKHDDQALIYASTGSCYGVVEGVCSEKSKISPLTLYGKTKADGEDLVIGKGGIALRLATVFGLSSRLRLDLLVNDLTLTALKDGKIDLYEGHFRRTFLHVTDAARAFMFALENCDKMKGNVYNVGDERMNITKLEVARLIESQVSGCKVFESMSGKGQDKRDYEVSYEKIRCLGYQAKVTVKQGIAELLNVLPYLDVDDYHKCRNA